MLKGHVFSKQLFGNPIFALFINTFLDGNNGISDNYKNGMAVTYSGSTVTVDSGAVCIQGRFLEEDSSTPIATGTETAFCKLVIEIDLDKQNTESEFVQGAYKIVKSASAYPELTQTNIVKNNSGIYQYELARFKTSTSGISDFQDMRTFLDFDSIYSAIEKEYGGVLEQLKQELAEVEDGSAYTLKNDFVVLYGKMTTTAMEEGATDYVYNTVKLNYPEGFNKDNTVVISIGTNMSGTVNDGYSFECLEIFDARSWQRKAFQRNVLLSDNIILTIITPFTDVKTIDYKIVLMKLPDIDVSNYQQGDVNMNGQITQEDTDLVLSYDAGGKALTDKQLKLAEMNGDGIVDALDALAIQKIVEGA